jgi:hypothetical protein
VVADALLPGRQIRAPAVLPLHLDVERLVVDVLVDDCAHRQAQFEARARPTRTVDQFEPRPVRLLRCSATNGPYLDRLHVAAGTLDLLLQFDERPGSRTNPVAVGPARQRDLARVDELLADLQLELLDLGIELRDGFRVGRCTGEHSGQHPHPGARQRWLGIGLGLRMSQRVLRRGPES